MWESWASGRPRGELQIRDRCFWGFRIGDEKDRLIGDFLMPCFDMEYGCRCSICCNMRFGPPMVGRAPASGWSEKCH